MEEEKSLFITQVFNDADLMVQSSTNWKYDTVYKLMPDALEGRNSVILLPQLQLSYAERSGGILYKIASPKKMFSIGIVTRCSGKACFGTTKLKKGDILLFDDKHANSLVTSNAFSSAVISIPKKSFRPLTTALAAHTDKVIHDTDGALAAKMETVLQQFQHNPSVHTDTSEQERIEKALVSHVETLLKEQTPRFPKLTKGEKIALQIRDRIYRRITKKVTITSLAEEFRVSEQTLQNAFKSLFGLTPNRFLRNLKLNHVRKALIHASAETDTIVRIAKKWGFTHMGHFSRYYTDLFGENPSVTLKREAPVREED